MQKFHKLMLINGENLTLTRKPFWLCWKSFLVWQSCIHEKWIDWGPCQCMLVAKEVEFVRYDDNIPSTPLTCFNHIHNWKKNYIQCYSQSPNQPLNKLLNHPIVKVWYPYPWGFIDKLHFHYGYLLTSIYSSYMVYWFLVKWDQQI